MFIFQIAYFCMFNKFCCVPPCAVCEGVLSHFKTVIVLLLGIIMVNFLLWLLLPKLLPTFDFHLLVKNKMNLPFLSRDKTLFCERSKLCSYCYSKMLSLFFLLVFEDVKKTFYHDGHHWRYEVCSVPQAILFLIIIISAPSRYLEVNCAQLWCGT